MRRWMMAAAVAAVLGTAPAAAGAGELTQVHATPTAAPQALVQAFFARLRQGQVRDAFVAAFQGTDMLAKKPADIDTLVNQVEVGLKFYGAPGEAEFVREEGFSPSVIRQIYVLRTERGPLFWVFYFYRTSAGWTLNSVDFNDNIRAVFS